MPMRTDILLLIAGMTLVTYIPRMLPAVLLEKLHFGPKVEKFLQLIPYTAMAALVFPGVVTLDPARPLYRPCRRCGSGTAGMAKAACHCVRTGCGRGRSAALCGAARVKLICNRHCSFAC